MIKGTFNQAAPAREDMTQCHAYRTSPEARKTLIQGGAQAATAAEYVDWLEGFLKAGGRITHIFNYDSQSRQVFHILRKDVEIPRLFGAFSLNIIVPANVNAAPKGQNVGHCNVYYMNNFRAEGGMVPVYADTLAEMEARPVFAAVMDKLNQAYALEKKEGAMMEFKRDHLRQQQERLYGEITDILSGAAKDAPEPPQAEPEQGGLSSDEMKALRAALRGGTTPK